MDTYDYRDLLADYRTIWNNRLLDAKDDESEVILKEAICRELLDENSHPRVRKNKYEKYYLAIKRLMASQVSIENKVKLIEIHTNLLEKLS